MYERILIAIDGSSTSDLALAEAVKLAGEHRARLRIAHIVDATSLFSGDATLVDTVAIEKALTESGRSVLERAAKTAAAAGVQAETRMLEMDQFGQRVADMVAAEAKAWPADLVVVGTHGRRGVSHLFLGSVAEGIARISPAPVLLVRGK